MEKISFVCSTCSSSIGYILGYIFNKIDSDVKSDLELSKKQKVFTDKCQAVLKKLNNKDLSFFSKAEMDIFFRSVSCECLKKEFAISFVECKNRKEKNKKRDDAEIDEFYSKMQMALDRIKDGDYEDEDDGHTEAIIKNDKLSDILTEKREEFCKIGTNKVKRRLNKLGKTDLKALLYRKALEIEDVSIQAKRTFGKYKDSKYKEKELLLEELVSLCSENGIKCGYHNSNNFSCDYVVYFELPNCDQISWHSNSSHTLSYYDSEWDGKVNSTLDKLEAPIERLLKDNDLLD